MPTALAAHLKLGELGEMVAARLLRQLGIDVLACNYSGPHGEIDIVGRDGGVLCFVEVKTRRSPRRSRPIDAVTPDKKWRISRTADRYLRQLGFPEAPHRFDVIEVIGDERALVDVRYWPHAFSADEGRLAPRGAHDPTSRRHLLHQPPPPVDDLDSAMRS
jgi:putative endonuclease